MSRTDVRSLVQTTLDTALADTNVRVYHQRRATDAAGSDDEYIVYTLDNDPYDKYADNDGLIRAAELTIRYYWRIELDNTQAGQAQVRGREAQIEAALRGAGFSLPQGYFDGGDIDDVGFYTTIFPTEYWEVV